MPSSWPPLAGEPVRPARPLLRLHRCMFAGRDPAAWTSPDPQEVDEKAFSAYLEPQLEAEGAWVAPVCCPAAL